MTLADTDLRLFLGDRLHKAVSPYLVSILCEPANDLLGRSGKNLRARLVRVGFECGNQQNTDALKLCESVVEALHAGSLIVDDIEDNSSLRRGQPCLHLRYGMPIALNTGNWLYFWPLGEIASRGLTPELELAMYRSYHRALLLAHVGQAIDVGVPADRVPVDSLFELCLASLELKSGALTALGMVMGGLASGADARTLSVLDHFGTRFGIALQMFDDLGNFSGQKDPSKKFEDLKLRRPSWLWAVLGRYFPDRLAGFIEAARLLPDANALDLWASQNCAIVEATHGKAVDYLNTALSDAEKSGIPASAHAALLEMSTQLTDAYK